ncbi:MAG TPA: glycoside hydrolase family 16 protein [Anaerolineales bacterium]|nr:glycoside hydrolase family 16 protein [Anaerolineales bacterium]
MRNIIFIILGVSVVTGCRVASTVLPTPTLWASVPVGPTATTLPTPTMALVFNDEFDSSHLNTNVWYTEHWWGRTNPPELQYYATDAFLLSDGILNIMGNKRSMGGMDYTSSIISTIKSFSFTDGYIEMRAKIPAGRGLWPAFWLTNDDGNKNKIWSEIDVFEFLCQEPTVLYMTFHYEDEQGQSRQIGTHINGPDFSKDFHIYAVNWSSESIVWFVDGVEQFRVTEHLPSEPMYIIANLQIGGNWPGPPDDTTSFPANYQIDYIRVYQKSN